MSLATAMSVGTLSFRQKNRTPVSSCSLTPLLKSLTKCEPGDALPPLPKTYTEDWRRYAASSRSITWVTQPISSSSMTALRPPKYSDTPGPKLGVMTVRAFIELSSHSRFLMEIASWLPRLIRIRGRWYKCCLSTNHQHRVVPSRRPEVRVG